MENPVINTFCNLDVHDTPFVGLDFDFEKNTLKINLQHYDDLNDCYVPFQIQMGGVNGFRSEYPQHQNIVFAPDGCYSVACSSNLLGGYTAVWVFEMGISHIWKVEVDFKTVEVTGGRSAEAQNYREEYFRNARES